MTYNITRAAVLGSGVMGATIAGHLAGVGIPVLLLDMVPGEVTAEEKAKGLTLDHEAVRSRLAAAAKERITNPKTMAMFDPADAALIETGNFEDHLGRLKEADWIIEVIVENLEVKKQLLTRIAPHIRDNAILSSNTSGISLNKMAQALPPACRKSFLGTHFFNPPRFMKLLELIPCQGTEPLLTEYMKEFSSRRLGKGVVIANDTPNFIANRIGAYNIQVTIEAMEKYGFSVPEVDAITGPAMGKPKSATFKTLDLVGLDTYCHVIGTVYNNVSDPGEKSSFRVAPSLGEMVKKGFWGDKAGRGFYKKEKGEKGTVTYCLNPASLVYAPVERVSLPALDEAAKEKTFQDRIRALVSGDDRVNLFAWEVIKKTLLYTAGKVPEISSSIKDIDQAMQWGFNWEIGPFALWDALGLRETVARMLREGEKVPLWVTEIMEKGGSSLYQDLETQVPKYINLKKEAQAKLIKGNREAALLDLGEGIACLEYRSKNNSIAEDLMDMTFWALDEVKANYRGLVIANQAKNFSVGANLYMILEKIEKKEWTSLDNLVKKLQDSNMALKYFNKPVVAAPYGMTLGGGAEVCLHCHHLTPHTETYMGLVEVGVGVVPAGGGTKESLVRAIEGVANIPEADTLPLVRRAVENIIMGRVSSSAKDARKLGYIRKSDRIIANSDYLVTEAKRDCLRLCEDFQPLAPGKYRITGDSGLASLKYVLFAMKSGGMISPYDEHVAGKIAWVMTGGGLPANAEVEEQYLLDLEREAFLSLCGEEKTVERIKYMLAKGKPLRN